MQPTPSPRYGAQVTRAAWPDPLFLPDLAVILGVASPSAARRFVLREAIPHLRLGKRLAVRAATLAEWLAARETVPEVAPPVPQAPKPPEWTRLLLKRGRSRGLDAEDARQRRRRS